MVGVNSSVSVNDNSGDLMENLKRLSKMDVLVGIPEETSSREGEVITNAELAFIHSKGSPLQNIPARPFIEPAIEDEENREQIIMPELNEAARNILDGNAEAFMNSLNRAGMAAQSVVRDWFTNPKNQWEPDSPLTIRRKGSDKPLIDTSGLRKSVSYVVREKD